jgi:hypothetical protein
MVRISLCLAKPGSVKRQRALAFGVGYDTGSNVEAGRKPSVVRVRRFDTFIARGHPRQGVGTIIQAHAAPRPGLDENLVTSFREMPHDFRNYRNAEL